MSPCGRFVSLLRSCYKTKCAFFRDDPENIQDIEWYFTAPDAPWIGKENIFNARTWYGGVDDWPEIGEVQDAPRLYSKGGNTRTGSPHGTDDQWEHGAYVEDAVPSDPCGGSGMRGLAFPGLGSGWAENFHEPLNPVLFFSPTIAYFEDPENPGFFWTFRRNDLMHPCGFAAGSDMSITDGPPDFNFFEEVFFRGDTPIDCLNCALQSLDAFFTIVVSFQPP
jgi:hypothetical protein